MNENERKNERKILRSFFSCLKFSIYFYKTVAIGTALISNIIYNVSIR